MIFSLVCIYIVGALITAGSLPNGIRDEMDGIGDLIKVLGWPVVMPIVLVYKLGKALYTLGTFFRPKK